MCILYDMSNDDSSAADAAGLNQQQKILKPPNWPDWYKESRVMQQWMAAVASPALIPRAQIQYGDQEKWAQLNHPLLHQFMREHVMVPEGALPKKRDAVRQGAMWFENLMYQWYSGAFGEVKLVNGQRTEHKQYIMADGGTVCTHIFWPEAHDVQTPVIFFIPSLTSNNRHYCRLIQHVLNEMKWIIVVYNRRGNCCKFTSPMFHVCGDDQDTHQVIQAIRERFVNQPMFGLGISMGGNLLIRYCGKYKIGPQVFLAAGSVCSPFSTNDIQIDMPLMELGVVKVMQRLWVEPMKEMLFALPNRVGVEQYLKLSNAKTPTEFVYANCEMYCKGGKETVDREYDTTNYMHQIQIPFLCLSSDNDELITYAPKTQLALTNSLNLAWVHTIRGHHCLYRGSVGQSFSQLNWAESLQLKFFMYILKHFQSLSASSTIINTSTTV